METSDNLQNILPETIHLQNCKEYIVFHGGDGDEHNSYQMNGKVGAIIHDGWRFDDIHYPGLFSSY